MLQLNIYLQMGFLPGSAYMHIIGHSDASSSLHREARGWEGIGVRLDGGGCRVLKEIMLTLFLSITSLENMVKIYICVPYVNLVMHICLSISLYWSVHTHLYPNIDVLIKQTSYFLHNYEESDSIFNEAPFPHNAIVIYDTFIINIVNSFQMKCQ